MNLSNSCSLTRASYCNNKGTITRTIFVVKIIVNGLDSDQIMSNA